MQAALECRLPLESGNKSVVYYRPVDESLVTLKLRTPIRLTEGDSSLHVWVEGHCFHLELNAVFIVVEPDPHGRPQDRQAMLEYMKAAGWLTAEEYTGQYLSSPKLGQMPEPRW